MSSIPTKQIDGDVAVGRNVIVGGKATFRGSTTIGHNLIVEGWLDAKNIKGPDKGLYRSVTKLREAYPRPHDGWCALVGESLPAQLYIAEHGAWIDTGNTAGNPTIESDVMNEAIGQLELSQAAQDEMLLALQQSVWPLDIVFTVNPLTIEVGAASTISTSWTVKRNGVNVLAKSTVKWSSPSESNVVVTQSSKSASLNPTTPGTSAFSISVEYEGMKVTRTANVTAVYPSYFGKVAADDVVTADIVTALAKVIQPSKAMTQTGIALANQRLCFAYPKSFGALASVKDGNNFETLTAYARTEATINGVAYYVYTMIMPVTASGIKQIYS